MIWLITSMYANIIDVGNETTSFDVLENSSIYIDHTRSLGLNEIKNGNITFKPNNTRRLLLGYSPNFDVWIKFTVKNTTDAKISRVLEYNNPMTTNIFFILLMKIFRRKHQEFYLETLVKKVLILFLI